MASATEPWDQEGWSRTPFWRVGFYGQGGVGCVGLGTLWGCGDVWVQCTAPRLWSRDTTLQRWEVDGSVELSKSRDFCWSRDQARPALLPFFM